VTPMYEVGTAIEVRALHVMPGVEGPEGELHAHDYRLEVVVGRADLGDRGMVCDLDVLDAALAGVADRLRDADLEVIRPPDAEAVTVEVFARWLHGTLAGPVAQGGGEHLAVRVWESPGAFGGYQATVG
jgi:6-pyruvoyltetrahydropterin/6-carboxytetrahydropterin synthase